MDDPKILVLGVGNLLMGDEGVGIHAVRQLASAELPPEVTLMDGGTGGFHLLSCIDDYDPIVMIDATMDGQEPGTVALIRPRFASDFPRSLSAHDIGLRDLIESASLLAPLPRIYLVTVSVDSIQPMTLDLSPPIQGCLPRITRLVSEIIASETDKNTSACYVIDRGTR